LGLRSLLRFKWAGWRVVHWSYDSLDYQKPTVEGLLERLRAAPPQGGDILLFHDDNELCLHALKMLIPEWKAQGYSFSRVDALLAQNPGAAHS
jgi:peptidoglycan/xylan/chitin deacetylase (PgdA/CDA1 family)